MSGPDERLFRAFTHSISGLSFHSELGGSRVREEEGVVYFSHSTFPHTWNGPNLEKHPHAPGKNWGTVSLLCGALGLQGNAAALKYKTSPAQTRLRARWMMCWQLRGASHTVRRMVWGWLGSTSGLDESECDRHRVHTTHVAFMLSLTSAGSSPEQQLGERGQRCPEDAGNPSLLEPWEQKTCLDTNSEKR